MSSLLRSLALMIRVSEPIDLADSSEPEIAIRDNMAYKWASRPPFFPSSISAKGLIVHHRFHH